MPEVLEMSEEEGTIAEIGSPHSPAVVAFPVSAIICQIKKAFADYFISSFHLFLLHPCLRIYYHPQPLHLLLYF